MRRDPLQLLPHRSTKVRLICALRQQKSRVKARSGDRFQTRLAELCHRLGGSLHDVRQLDGRQFECTVVFSQLKDNFQLEQEISVRLGCHARIERTRVGPVQDIVVTDAHGLPSAMVREWRFDYDFVIWVWP